MDLFFGGIGGGKRNSIPQSWLISWWKASQYNSTLSEIPDTKGATRRTLYPLQFIQANGTGYFTHASLTVTCTCPTKSGTSTVGFATAGRITITSGTLWSFTILWDDALTSTYEYATLLDSTHAVCFDVSGNGRNLTAVGFTMATMCASGLVSGGDWLNQRGVTIADGTQYFDDTGVQIIPEGVAIPALANSLSVGSWSIESSVNTIVIYQDMSVFHFQDGTELNF